MNVSGAGVDTDTDTDTELRSLVNEGDLLVIKDPTGDYTITVQGSASEAFYTLQIGQLPDLGAVFELVPPGTLWAQGIAAEGTEGTQGTEAGGTQDLETEIPVYVSFGNEGLSNVSFELTSFTDPDGTDLELPALSTRIYGKTLEESTDFSVTSGDGKVFLPKFTLPKNLVEGSYTLGLEVTVSGNQLNGNLDSILAVGDQGTPWMRNPDGSYKRLVSIMTEVRAVEEISGPESILYNGAEISENQTITLNSMDSELSVSGTIAADRLAVLFVDDMAADIFVPDSFGNFSGSYLFAPREETYAVYLKGASYSGNYSSTTTTSAITVQALLPTDELAPEIVLITPPDGATMDHDTAKIIFAVTDLQGTVEAVTLKLDGVDLSDGIYQDELGRYAYNLVGGLDNGSHALIITARDDSNNGRTLNAQFTSSGQSVVTFLVANVDGAIVKITGTNKTAR